MPSPLCRVDQRIDFMSAPCAFCPSITTPDCGASLRPKCGNRCVLWSLRLGLIAPTASEGGSCDQVANEPVARQDSHLLKRAGFLEEMRGVPDHFDAALG